MRNFILLFAVIVCLTSCNPHYYYQICKVSSNLPTSENGAYYYSTPYCDITYNIWSEYGDIYFAITNKTDKVIYINLTKSFFSKNGIAYDYFLNRTIGSSTTRSKTKEFGVSGTALGYWDIYGKSIPGSISMLSVNSVTTQESSSISYEEKPIIAIPPHSTKIFCEYSIMKSHYKDCNLIEAPQKDENVIMTFSEEDTPIEFSNYICYRIEDNEKEQFVENRFYLSQVTNQHYNATFHKVDAGCDNDLYKTKDIVFIHTSPKEFYIEYKPEYSKKSNTIPTSSKYSKSVKMTK